VLEPSRGASKPILAAERLHGDGTTVPVLAKGKMDIGRCWVYVRDDRPFGGPTPPAAKFYYSRDRRVINLCTAVDRLNHMSRQLGGDFERIDAVLGRALPDHLAANFPDTSPLLVGEVGCYASHLIAAETISARRLPYALVLEDDVDVGLDFRSTIGSAVEAMRGEWDILSLSGAKQHPHRSVAGPFGEDRRLVRYLHFPKTTAAYVLSASGTRKLLATRVRMRPVDVDIRYGWEMGLTGYGIFPPLAGQSGKFVSSIPKVGKQRFYWRSAPLGYLRGRLGRLRRFGLSNLARSYLAHGNS